MQLNYLDSYSFNQMMNVLNNSTDSANDPNDDISETSTNDNIDVIIISENRMWSADVDNEWNNASNYKEVGVQLLRKVSIATSNLGSLVWYGFTIFDIDDILGAVAELQYYIKSCQTIYLNILNYWPEVFFSNEYIIRALSLIEYAEEKVRLD